MREGARPEFVEDSLGRVDNRVTQTCYSKSWWKGFPDEPESRLRRVACQLLVNAVTVDVATSTQTAASPAYWDLPEPPWLCVLRLLFARILKWACTLPLYLRQKIAGTTSFRAEACN
jgi:hypothetical protein